MGFLLGILGLSMIGLSSYIIVQTLLDWYATSLLSVSNAAYLLIALVFIGAVVNELRKGKGKDSIS